MLDIKGTGKISIAQLPNTIRCLDPTAKHADINNMKKLLDKDGINSNLCQVVCYLKVVQVLQNETDTWIEQLHHIYSFPLNRIL